MKTIVSLFQESVSQFGTYPALLMRPRWRLISLTYNDWSKYAQGIAKLLASHNVGYQDRVIIIMPNSPFWGGALMGIMWRGAIAVPLNTKSTPEFVERIRVETKASCIITISALELSFQSSLPRIDLDKIPNLHTENHTIEPYAVSSHDIAEIVYTSGTTGEPKGVVLTHNNIVSDIESIYPLIDASSSDRAVSILPLFHMYEQAMGLLLCMKYGASIMYSNNVSTRALTQALQEYRATKILLVPDVLDSLVRKVELRAIQKNKEKALQRLFTISRYLPFWIRRLLFRRVHKQLGGCIEIIFSGGAPLSTEVEQKLNAMGFIVLQGYGLTETSPVVTTNTPSYHRLGSVGKPIPGDVVTIADDGEILIEGPNVFMGYYQNELLTKSVFDERRRYKTGDLGHIDKNGFLFVQGRKKYVIVTARGEKVHPEDVEQELKKNSQVSDVAVVGHQVNDRELVHAIFLPSIKNPQEIIDQANKQLAPHQHIQEWSIWTENDFPRSATRKVKKDILIEWLSKSKEEREQEKQTRSATPLFSLLASISKMPVQNITQSSKLVSDLHFDSLMRIEFVNQIEEHYNVLLPEHMITDQTTVADIEKLIANAPKPEEVQKIKTWMFGSFVRVIGLSLLYIFIYPIYRLLISLRINGKEHVQELKGPAIFMVNHTTYADAAIVLWALPWKLKKRIAIAAAHDFVYKTYWFVIWLFELIFAIYPLPRTQEENIKPGLEMTGKLLDKGYSILIFPEGKVSKEGTLQELKLGAGLLATEMEVPVIPVYIQGLRDCVPEGKVFPRKRCPVTVNFGKPLQLDSSTSYADATQQIYALFKELEAKKTI